MAKMRRRRFWDDEEKRRIVAQTQVPGVSVSLALRSTLSVTGARPSLIGGVERTVTTSPRIWLVILAKADLRSLLVFRVEKWLVCQLGSFGCAGPLDLR